MVVYVCNIHTQGWATCGPPFYWTTAYLGEHNWFGRTGHGASGVPSGELKRWRGSKFWRHTGCHWNLKHQEICHWVTVAFIMAAHTPWGWWELQGKTCICHELSEVHLLSLRGPQQELFLYTEPAHLWPPVIVGTTVPIFPNHWPWQLELAGRLQHHLESTTWTTLGLLYTDYALRGFGSNRRFPQLYLEMLAIELEIFIRQSLCSGIELHHFSMSSPALPACVMFVRD